MKKCITCKETAVTAHKPKNKAKKKVIIATGGRGKQRKRKKT